MLFPRLNKVLLTLFLLICVHGFCASPEKTCALLVRGEFEERFENNEILAFNTLSSLGISQSQIYVLSPFFSSQRKSDYNGDGVKDVDYALLLESVGRAIEEIGSNIPSDGQLLIYLNSHGSRSGLLGLWGDDSYVVLNTGTKNVAFPEYLYGRDLDALISQYIPNSVEVILIVQACQGGGFTNTFLKPNRLVIAATAVNNSSYGCYIDDKEWSRFSYSFFTAIQEGLRNYLEIFEIAKTRGKEIPPSTFEELIRNHEDTPEILFGSENIQEARLGE